MLENLLTNLNVKQKIVSGIKIHAHTQLAFMPLPPQHGYCPLNYTFITLKHFVKSKQTFLIVFTKATLLTARVTCELLRLV